MKSCTRLARTRTSRALILVSLTACGGASDSSGPTGPTESPDGAYIVYVRSPALNVNEIVIARVSDGSMVRTIPEPAGGTVNNPRWGLLR